MNAKSQQLWVGGLMAAIIGLGAWLRFHAIGAKPVWLDESFSIWLGNQGLRQALHWILAVDQHPPLYYTLLHVWQKMLGDGQGAVRGLSALCGVLAIPVFYAATRRLVDRPTAVLAAFLLALSPFHVRFAQEARMYTLLTLGVAVALYFLARVLTDRCSSRGAWFGLAAAQAGVMLSHNTATAFFPIALNLPILGAAIYYRFRPAACPWPAMAERGFLLRWFLVQGLAVLLWLPWAYPFYVQSHRVYGEFWIRPPTGRVVWRAFETFSFALLPKDYPWHDTWSYVYWVVGGLGLIWLMRVPARALLFASLFATAIVGELLVSLRRPIFYDRTLIWTTLAYYTLIAAGIRSLGGLAETTVPVRRRLVGVVQILLLIIVLNLEIPSLASYFSKFQKEDWVKGADHVARNASPGDLVLFNATWVQIPFEYYYRHRNTPVVMKGVPVDLFDRGILEPKMTVDDVPRLVDLCKGRDRVWLVYSHDFYTDPQQIVLRSLARVMNRTDLQELVGLRLVRFDGRKREWDVADLQRYLNERRPHEFVYECPGARRVAVVGTFNSWDTRQDLMTCDTAGVWRARIDLPLGDHEYEFRIDDSRWTEDPKNPRKRLTPFGYYTSLLTIE